MEPNRCISDTKLTVNVVVLKDSSSTSKKVDTTLQTRKDLVVFECGIALAGDPHSSVGVGKDLVLQELPTTLYTHTHTHAQNMMISHLSPQ